MLEVLLWLDRFDLDGNQITNRRLRSLAENKRMPLRKVHRVNYDCAADDSHTPDRGNTLRIYLEKDERGEPIVVEVKIGEFHCKCTNMLVGLDRKSPYTF